MKGRHRSEAAPERAAPPRGRAAWPGVLYACGKNKGAIYATARLYPLARSERASNWGASNVNHSTGDLTGTYGQQRGGVDRGEKQSSHRPSASIDHSNGFTRWMWTAMQTPLLSSAAQLVVHKPAKSPSVRLTMPCHVAGHGGHGHRVDRVNLLSMQFACRP